MKKIVRKSNRVSKNYRRLTDKEILIVKYVAQDYKLTDIARLSHLTYRTVSCRVSQIYEKLDVNTFAGITHWAFANNLIDNIFLNDFQI